jgi:hypothetical protein
MMEKKIKVDVIKSFGRIRYYPACELSRMMAEICRCKSFTLEQLAIMEKYGFAVEKVPVVR